MRTTKPNGIQLKDCMRYWRDNFRGNFNEELYSKVINAKIRQEGLCQFNLINRPHETKHI